MSAKTEGDEKSESEKQQNSASLDGSAFLDHVRTSGALAASANDDTIGASNSSSKDKHRRDVSSLSDLFENSLEDINNTNVGGNSPVRNQSKLPPRPTAVHKGNRNVSWGNNDSTHQPNLMQPRLEDTPPPPTSPSSEQQLRYNLDDLLSSGPYEQEAETNILRALEEQQAIRARANTGTSTILSGVPESISHDFSTSSFDHSSQDGEHSSSGERSSSLGREPSSSRLRRRSQSISQDREQTNPLLERKRNNKAHRRTMSVEETLAGLTSAMSALDHSHNPATIQEEQPSSGVGQFVQNAVLLTRHEEEQQQSPRGQQQTAKDRWNYLLDNLPVLREAESGEIDETVHGSSDDNSPVNGNNEADVEAGVPVADETSIPPSKQKRKKKGSDAIQKGMNAANDKFHEDWETWTTFFHPRKDRCWSYIKLVLLYVMVPLTAIAAILFYATGNPPTGLSEDGSSGDTASASWWLLFVVRQVITLSLALSMQLLIIDFIAINTRLMLRLIGPILTLMVVQSKGYPFVFFWWAVFDFSMLFGSGEFAKHWLFWQESIGLFNAQNPSGHIVDSVWNMRVLTIAISVSAAVAVKRFVVGLYMARQTYANFGQKLARVLNKMLLISEVGGLAKEIEKAAKNKTLNFPSASEKFGGGSLHFDLSEADEDESTSGATPRKESMADIGPDNVIDMNNRDPLTGSLNRSEKLKIMQLLERWEEPDRYYSHQQEEATISAVLRFRNALAMMNKQYPFSYAFGPADSREVCLDSAQRVYTRLIMKDPDQVVLHFDTLALLAVGKDGTIDQEKAKGLVKLFRPDRNGNLTMLDFLKSTDRVYKEYRLLQASIQNSSRIDQSLEKISNWIFYIVVTTIILAALGLDPLALFLSLSSIVLAFAFMISSASSKFFEGLLFILVRRPYNIGDLINVSNVEVQTSFDGAPGWIVENVTLFETECTWAPTNERASLSNGSLANSRIINWARSPQAQFHIFLNLPINTPYEKILILKSAVEEYMKARPREWLALNGFRANRIFPEKGFVEYLIVIMHRDSWQMIGQVLDSKANLSSYCMEVTKQLGLNYRAPPLPVSLTYSKAAADVEDSVTQEVDGETQLREFRSFALKHNIKVA